MTKAEIFDNAENKLNDTVYLCEKLRESITNQKRNSSIAELEQEATEGDAEVNIIFSMIFDYVKIIAKARGLKC